MSKKQKFWALDFEASSLNMAISYPIEVGYTNGVDEWSSLILPNEDWFDWDPASQEIHGIARSELFEHGKPGPEVCATMNKDLAGQVVYCDGGMYDILWLHRLFDAVGVKPEFQLQHYSLNYHDDELVAHRALADAKQIWRLIDLELSSRNK